MKDLFIALARSGAVRGPYRERLLPPLGKALREEQWPLPLAVRRLNLLEMAVLDRRAMDEREVPRWFWWRKKKEAVK